MRVCFHQWVVPPRHAVFLSREGGAAPAAGVQQLEDFPPNYLTLQWEHHSKQLHTGPNKSHFSSLPTGDFFWKAVPHSFTVLIHRCEWKRACSLPATALLRSFSTVREGQEGQPALHVWPEPGQHLALFITQPCLPSALALDITLPSFLHRLIL